MKDAPIRKSAAAIQWYAATNQNLLVRHCSYPTHPFVIPNTVLSGPYFSRDWGPISVARHANHVGVCTFDLAVS